MKKIIATVIILISILSAGTAIADEANQEPVNKKQLPNTISLQNPIGEDDPRKILGNILKTVLGLVGSLALVVFVYGGLTWMTSAGNSDRVKSGRDTLIWAGIGLIVIFASYTIVAFILQTIIQT